MYRMLYCRWQNVHMCMCPGFHLGVGGGRARECIPLPWKPVAPLESLFHHYELLINAYNLGSKSIVIYPVNVYFAIWHDMLWFSLTLITWALLYKLTKLVKTAYRCHLTKPKIDGMPQTPLDIGVSVHMYLCGYLVTCIHASIIMCMIQPKEYWCYTQNKLLL